MLSKTGHKVQAKGLADAQEAVAFRKCRFWILSILTCQQILIDLQSGIQHFIKDLLCSPIWLFSLAFIVTWGPLWVLTPEVALVVAEEEGNLNPALERHLPPLCKEWYLHGLPASPDTPWRLLQCHEACRRTWCPAHHCTFQRCSEKRTVLYSSVLLSHPISSYLVATLPSLLWRQVARPAEILWHNVSHLNSKLLTEDPRHLFEKNSDSCPAEKLGDKRTKAPDGFPVTPWSCNQDSQASMPWQLCQHSGPKIHRFRAKLHYVHISGVPEIEISQILRSQRWHV